MRTTTAIIVLTASIATIASVEGAHAGKPDCEGQNCGTNTAVLRQQRINALHLGGEVNADGVRILVESFRLDPLREVWCRKLRPAIKLGRWPKTKGFAPLVLSIRDGELAAVSQAWDAPNPEEVYTRKCLRGATFDLVVPIKRTNQAVVRVKLGAQGQVSTWVVGDNPIVPLKTERLVSYQVLDIGDPGKPVALCPEAPAMEPWQSPVGAPPDAIPPGLPVDVDHPKVPTDRALVYQGETYDDRGTLDPQRSGPGWFYFTCPGTALQKLRLMGFNPMNPKAPEQTPRMRQGTLKMITARYNGKDSYTGKNIPLIWRLGYGTPDGEPFAGTQYSKLAGGAHAGPDTGVLEAVWGGDGALCISEHLRVWDKSIDDTVQVPFKSHYIGLAAAMTPPPKAEEIHVKTVARGIANARVCSDGLAFDEPPIWSTYSPDHNHN